MDHYTPLFPGNTYYLIAHAVGSEQLFREQENYRFFLARFFFYAQPVVKTITYCLMPNHFHFMIQVRSEQDIGSFYHQKKNSEPVAEMLPVFVMQQFSNLLNSYSKAYNKVYKRRGALFVDHLKRIEVNDDQYFTALVLYVHNNPVKHGFCSAAGEWKWSGYHEILSDAPTYLERNEVLQWFGGRTPFMKSHESALGINLEGL